MSWQAPSIKSGCLGKTDPCDDLVDILKYCSPQVLSLENMFRGLWPACGQIPCDILSWICLLAFGCQKSAWFGLWSFFVFDFDSRFFGKLHPLIYGLNMLLKRAVIIPAYHIYNWVKREYNIHPSQCNFWESANFIGEASRRPTLWVVDGGPCA